MEENCAPQVVCLGFFDGVHKGHLALLDAAKAAARGKGWPICVHTFDHAPGSKGRELTPLAEKEALLRAAGADHVAVSIFNDEMRTMSGPDFFQKIAREKLHAVHVVCGDDHRFGYKGGWGVKDLAQMCREAGIGLTVVPEVTLKNGQRISSTAIRAALERGDLALAEEMLGRPVPNGVKSDAKTLA